MDKKSKSNFARVQSKRCTILNSSLGKIVYMFPARLEPFFLRSRGICYLENHGLSITFRHMYGYPIIKQHKNGSYMGEMIIPWKLFDARHSIDGWRVKTGIGGVGVFFLGGGGGMDGRYVMKFVGCKLEITCVLMAEGEPRQKRVQNMRF